jgi:hypothetical protein
MARHPSLTGRIPKLVEGEDLQIGGYGDSTEWYRVDIGQVDHHRTHRRHVTEPIGSPLIKFRSRVECLSAIVDVLHGMYFFYKIEIIKKLSPFHQQCADNMIYSS